jgi:hypothetical protein
MAAANGGTAASSERLLIVGPGVLGSYLGKLWIDDHGADTVVGQTNTTTNHAKWVLPPVSLWDCREGPTGSAAAAAASAD